MSIMIGIDHGYYAIKTAHCSFPAGLTSYGEHEPYTRQGLLEFGGCFFVCGSGRQPMVSTIITQSGSSGMSSVTLPQELIDAINNVGFWDSIPLWAVTLIGGLLITVLSFTMILTVYGRMFSLWMYAAIAPIPLSTFAGEPTGSVGKNFIRSYAGVCLQGVVIALSCIIFSAISSSPPAVDTSASVVTAVWTYVGELAFNLLVLVGAIKGCDRIVKEIMGL